MRYGVDIAVRRADDLDKLMESDVSVRVAHGDLPTVLDIGCGAGGQAKRLASLGAFVTAVDVTDYSKEFMEINSVLKSNTSTNIISFIKADIKNWILTNVTNFDIVCFQRTLHYLRYNDAKYLLNELRQHTNGRLYLSVTGADSAIAESYPVLDVSIDERFAKLKLLAQETFSITVPLCIYREEEILTLLEDCGWNIEQLRVSDFGNIKLVATPRREAR